MADVPPRLVTVRRAGRAVRVLGEDGRRCSPIRPGTASSGPFSRVADDRDRRARPRIDEAQRPARRAPARAARRCRCAGRRRAPRARSVPPAKLDRRVVLAGDDVRRGHDDARPRDPAAALDPEPAGRAERCARRSAPPRARPGCARTRGSGGSVGTGGRRCSGTDRRAPSAFSSVRGGTIAFSRSRMTERWTARRSCGLARQLQRHRAEHPDHAEPDQRADHHAAGRVERAAGSASARDGG